LRWGSRRTGGLFVSCLVASLSMRDERRTYGEIVGLVVPEWKLAIGIVWL